MAETPGTELSGARLAELIVQAEAALKRIESVALDASATSEVLNQTKTEVSSSVAAIKQASTEAGPLLSAAQQAVAQITPLQEQIALSRTQAAELLEKITKDKAATGEIARTADEKDKRVQDYEKKLTELTSIAEQFQLRLNKLLPGATSVGLAKSFFDRRKSLLLPIGAYFFLFLCSIAGFVVLGWHGLDSGKVRTLDELFRYLLERAPIVVALILLEEFSRRQFSATTKLSEDYAYKETMSIAFEGYKNAMNTVNDPNALSTVFSKTVIEMLAKRPGRLLELDSAPPVRLDSFVQKAAAPAATGNADLPNIVQAVKDTVKAAYVKGSVVVILCLAVGIAIGYYAATRPAPVNATVSATVQLPQTAVGTKPLGAAGAK